MKKTRKYFSLFAILLMMIFAVGCVFMTACGNKDDDDEKETTHTHTYDGGVVTKEATCEADGEMTYTCVDGDDSYTEVIPATGHDYVLDTENERYVAVGCETDGTNVYVCSNCGNTYTETVTATGHDYVVDTTAAGYNPATCTEDGTGTYVCSNCGDSYTGTIPATGHDYDVTFAGWTNDGNGGYTTSVTVTCKNDANETFIEDTDYTMEIEENSGVWTATVALNDDESTIIGIDKYKPEGESETEEPEDPLNIVIDFSQPDTYSWIPTESIAYTNNSGKTTTYAKGIANDKEIAYGYVTLVSTKGDISSNAPMSIGTERENSLNTAGGSSNSKGRYFEIKPTDYAGKYITIELSFVSNGSTTRSMAIAASNAEASATSSLAFGSSTGTDDPKTINWSQAITDGTDLFITCDLSVNILTLKITIMEDNPNSGTSTGTESFEGVILSGETSYIGDVSFANNTAKLSITQGTDGTYTVSGNASIMDECQATAFNASDSEAGDAYVILSVWGNEGDTIVFTNDRNESKSVSFDDGADILNVIFRVTNPETNSLTFTITAKDSTEAYATYTVTFAGVVISGEDDDNEDAGETKGGTFEFSYEELCKTVFGEEEVTDKTPIDASYFETESNSFLTYIGSSTSSVEVGKSSDQIRNSSNGSCIEVKGQALQVTFEGTGTLTITFRSTGKGNTSSIALIDENGNYIQGVVNQSTITNGAVVTEKQLEDGGYFYVITEGTSTGAGFVSITFTIFEAGTYTIATAIGVTNEEGEKLDDRATRIQEIVMVDNVSESKSEEEED